MRCSELSLLARGALVDLDVITRLIRSPVHCVGNSGVLVVFPCAVSLSLRPTSRSRTTMQLLHVALIICSTGLASCQTDR